MNLALIISGGKINATGSITVDSTHQFTVDFDKAGAQSIVCLSCADTFELDLNSFIAQLDSSLAQEIPDLTIGVSQPYILIDKQNGFIVSLGLSAALDLSGLPLAGSELSQNIQIKGLQVVYVSNNFDQSAVQSINTTLANLNLNTFNSDASTLVKGLSLNGLVNIKNQNLNISSNYSSTVAATGASAPSSNSVPASPTKIGKNFGPVYLQSIKPSFKNGDLALTFNASISMAGVNLSFQDLKVGSPIDKFSPVFSLKGLGIDYQNPTVTIGGALLHDGVDQYSGMATLSLKKLQLSAFGSYQKTNDGTSLFVYGVLNYPLGGPSFFFVTGLAALFGYNRKIVMPQIADVSNFPLIAAAMGTYTDPTQLLSDMETDLPVDSGEYVLGLGVKFTSFKVVNSFALITASFGNSLEFNVLGESRYIAPEPSDPAPVAVVELDILGSFNPSSGSFLVQGQLTPNSYVINPNCHLQGGFAYAFWTSGSNAGDFVSTFGGYGNNVIVPDYYPQNIPALGFSWQYSDDLSFKRFWLLGFNFELSGGGSFT
jgi:hypothetical protein